MDPRDIQNYQNNMNIPGHGQQQMMNPQDHYNQMILQQQYMNQFQFYGQNQMINMEPFQQQQYNNLMMQQQIPMFQQPQQHMHPQQVLSQQAVQQQPLQHNHQRFMQDQPQLQQQSQHQSQHQHQPLHQLPHQQQHQNQHSSSHQPTHASTHQPSHASTHQPPHASTHQPPHASTHQPHQTQLTSQHQLHQNSIPQAIPNQIGQVLSSIPAQSNIQSHQHQHQMQPQARQQPSHSQSSQQSMPPQQQLTLHEQQQRLLEEQSRQMEIKRQEELNRKRQKELAEREEQQRKQRELMIQREKEHQEMLRQQEEALRLEEEKKKREEAERIEREKLMKIRDEQLQRQREDERLKQECATRMENFRHPVALVATHFINNFMGVIPFPSESLEKSSLTCVCSDDALPILDNSSPDIVKMISQALSKVDIRDIRTRLDHHGELAETNDLPLAQMPPLIKDVMEYNCNALDVEPEHNMGIAETEHLLNEMEDDLNRPSMSHVLGGPVTNSVPSVPNKEPQKVQVQLDQEAIKLRRQMASVGKQPKAQTHRKKKDMVECLFDSLTDYFDPTQGRRRRNRTKTLEEEQAEQQDIEMISKMEASEQKMEEESGSDEENKFYDKKKKRKKEEREERPPTPTEVIHQRELEWNERQRKRLEKRKRRRGDENIQECWNNDVMAENDSFNRFMLLVDQILDQVEDMDVLMACNNKTDEEEEDDDVSQELLIDRAVLDDLRNQTQKLKSWKKLNRVPVDRLVKLETMLERNMKDVISQDGSRLLVPVILEENAEEEDVAFRELIHERLARAADAACTALMIMTSYKMPKQVFIEDTIERAINLCKQYLNHIIFPASDSVFRSNNSKKQKAEDPRRKRKAGVSNRSHTVQKIYDRIADLVGCFSELVRVQLLPETSIHHLSSMAVASFFVSNVGELQRQAMLLASNIFAISSEGVRVGILTDILNSLHRLPPGKNTNNSYRLGPEQWISNTTVLILQLIQSAVKMPKRKRNDDEDNKNEINPDSIVKDSFKDAQRLAGTFLNGFLAKCSCKGSKTDGEEDYRRLFDAFLQDLLAALHKPPFPAAEFILNILGTLLVKYYRAKSTDIVIRQACLDYLGSITARLRKDAKSAVEDSEKRLEIVVKTIIYDDEEEPQFENVSDVDISEFSASDRLKKLEQALIDFLVDKMGDDISVDYAIKYYAAEWYKETAEDLDIARQNFKSDKSTELTEKDKRKLEKKMERMNEKAQTNKEFLTKLVDKKQVKKRTEHIRKTGNVMLDSDASWTVKYLASRREFTHSFDSYLKIILYGIQVESTVSLRTKAMKCLTQIIEADYEVLGMPDVRLAVNSRMIDPNAAVREATIELLGKFLLVKEEFIPDYYGILLERIKDSGTAVRKRVIRIMREICEKYPNYKQIPDMLSKLVRRITDEDGVKKLVQETFMALWFQPCSERSADVLCKKVMQMTLVAQICANESTIDFLEQLLQALLKTADKNMLAASKQIVDSLVDSILTLETKMASDGSRNAEDPEDQESLQNQKENQERLLASLTTLSMFSKVRPELLVRHAETLQPYLSMTVRSNGEQAVLNKVICMLERVVPLMSHPSDAFLQGLDESLSNLMMTNGVTIVVSVVACAAAVYNHFPRKQTTMAQKFLYFLRNLNSMQLTFQQNDRFTPSPSALPVLQRSLFAIGLLCRYFDFDTMLENDAEAARSLVVVNLPPCQTAAGESLELADDKPENRRYRDNVFFILSSFSRNHLSSIRLRAISSIGHLCARHAQYLGRGEIKHMYKTLLVSNDPQYLQLKIQTLKNLEMFLLAEEKKLMKSNEEWDKAKDQQNLKEMELAGSGMSSAVIQIYWLNVLSCYFNNNEAVRQSAVQVAWLTLSQGLVTPGSSIATLVAMTTDPIVSIRNKVENLLKEIDTKYAGMVQSKAINGIRVAYKLHSQFNREKFSIIRGIRICDSSSLSAHAHTNLDQFGLPRFSNDGQAILSGLYQSLRGNRSHRRSFLNSVLRLFSEDSREKLPLSEWIFVADNIAMFPYQVLDEPLYTIRQIDGIIALSGQSILNQFKDRLISGFSSSEDDDSLFEPDHIYRRFPESKCELFDLMVNSQACFILLYLKNFLMKLYGFTEVKVQEYSPSEAAKVYEKAVTRRNIPMFHPHSALEEMRPEVIEERNTIPGHYKLAHKICNFRKMLLALDRLEDDGGDENEDGVTTGVTERDDDEEDVDRGQSENDEPASESQPMEEE